MAHKQDYMVRMELNKQRRLEAGLVSERFPDVSSIVVHMTYYNKGINPVQMVRVINLFPTSYAYFKMGCLIKGCVEGGFDFTSVINNMIKNHKKLGKGKLVCGGKNDDLASDHASIAYEVNIQYNKLSK
ncbi:MAG: hypothetical protein COY75_00220 [Nitrospirae bacterium CG_4_10_14_0_8_um_filter_41_23]|nr:hypothetical protein [Nitrospirota bacterium]OIP59846.1 MAG: hypothetical protein AUK38_04675 [Nitrospirae bacterium CG2_30_41_42]PIQ93175.1 MAG: hypothetical protein COV68_11255 [Nitrospirae bacterium CG11_big_fil_rev_8_21_14_0_20_41_14]PIV44751.1 MAG: hypothetical protein COS27_00645 [Nitrospirae bacterium CG02_land_8_20_14_3_00_41_53]PIW87473.1 MAG: hypothetical protein COZ94_04915 [Nitrospirae bacterium CG_4_8_14_3_um_filter_41_47]PIY87907.1 MAG: hypothetical protein COY75_00220 [Nitros